MPSKNQSSETKPSVGTVIIDLETNGLLKNTSAIHCIAIHFVEDGETITYNSYEPLKEAIESYLINSVKDMARIVTKSKTRDDEQQKKFSDMIQTLMDDYGYNEESAEEILTYASNNLWRDS